MGEVVYAQVKIVKWILLLAGICAVAVIGAGCGAGSESGGGGETTAASEAGEGTEESGGSSPGVEEAAKFVEEHTALPTEIPLTTPLKKAPARGKRVLYLEPATSSGKSYGEALAEASKLFGWKLETIEAGSSPESVSNAWSLAVSRKPDAVVSGGFPRSLFEKQLKQISRAGIPNVEVAITEPVGNGITAVIAGVEDYETRGEYMANWVVADSDGAADVAFFNIGNYPILEDLEAKFESTLNSLCPDCEMSKQTVDATEIGSKLPQEVVNYLRQHPDVNYVVMAFGEMTVGIRQALDAAGLEDVKIVAQSGGDPNLQAVEEGAEAVNVPEATRLQGWMMADAVARAFNGEEIDAAAYQVIPKNFVTQANAAETKRPYEGVANYRKQFEELWNVGG